MANIDTYVGFLIWDNAATVVLKVLILLLTFLSQDKGGDLWFVGDSYHKVLLCMT